MASTEEMMLRIGLSILTGAIIGAEREYRSKSAGFRTIILISLGSCLFTIVSVLSSSSDRIAAGIVTGIGFLGAGVIFKSDNRVTGLTTAATIWTASAIGMGLGAGFYLYSLVGCIVALLVLMLFTYLETFIDRVNQVRSYRIVSKLDRDKLGYYENRLRHHHLSFHRGRQATRESLLSGIWIVQGSEKNHEAFIRETLEDESVKEFEF